MIRPTRRLLAVLAIAALGFTSAACGGGGDGDTAASTDDEAAASREEASSKRDSREQSRADSKTEAGDETAGDDTADETGDDTASETNTGQAQGMAEIRGEDVDTTADAIDAVVTSAIEDLQAFWAEELPAQTGQDYTPISSAALYSYNEDDPPPACGADGTADYADVAGNAFYCGAGNFVAWDTGELMPDLIRNYGEFTVAMVMAHEWGHAIQGQLQIDGPTVYLEQQADCFAGAWGRRIAAGESPTLALGAGGLDAALGGMIKFRDEPGTAVADPQAHGSAFDRVRAFQEGFLNGSAKCFDYLNNPPPVVELPWNDGADIEQGGDIPYDEFLPLITDELSNFYVSLAGGEFIPPDHLIPYVVGEGEPPSCGSTPLDESARGQAYFCPDDNTVLFDEEMLRSIHAQIGDLGSATVLATQWAVSAEIQAGLDAELITSDAGMNQRACLTGVWLASFVNGAELEGRQLSLSPGDLDEAMAAFIAFAQPDAADPTHSIAFERVAFMRNGFVDGVQGCQA